MVSVCDRCQTSSEKTTHISPMEPWKMHITQQQTTNADIYAWDVHSTHIAFFPFSSPPFWLLHFDSVLVLWKLTVESILSETKWYFTLAAVSCCNFLFKHLYAPAMPFKTSELSYCVMTEWNAVRGDAAAGRGFKMRPIVFGCILFCFLSVTCSPLIPPLCLKINHYISV